jgi:hypothetical protein
VFHGGAQYIAASRRRAALGAALRGVPAVVAAADAPAAASAARALDTSSRGGCESAEFDGRGERRGRPHWAPNADIGHRLGRIGPPKGPRIKAASWELHVNLAGKRYVLHGSGDERELAPLATAQLSLIESPDLRAENRIPVSGGNNRPIGRDARHPPEVRLGRPVGAMLHRNSTIVAVEPNVVPAWQDEVHRIRAEVGTHAESKGSQPYERHQHRGELAESAAHAAIVPDHDVPRAGVQSAPRSPRPCRSPPSPR